jgi:nucleotidyltransferase substrate binding protein (TIGR01987 family)
MPMPLDLSSLRDALAALDVSLGYLDSDAAADPGLRDQFRAAAIQAFEFTYEPAFKFMKRQLARSVPVPSAVDELGFMQVVRAAAEAGLVADVSRFHEYREARNITSHSYDRQKAQRIVAGLPRFADDVRYLLSRLEARNRAGD